MFEFKCHVKNQFSKMRWIVFLACLFIFTTARAQYITLSPEATVSLITPEPGQEAIFTIYGHSAIRIHDPANNLDTVFDYGIFDFQDPNFSLNFAKGYLRYMVGGRNFSRFTVAYKRFDRTIHEQILNLTQEEKQRTFEFLANNARPENRYYFYDYFYDNCATKIRDVFQNILGDKLVFDESYVVPKHSFRDMVDSLSVYQPWGDFGIDICLGLPMDKKMSPLEYMFLPGYVFKGFSQATIKRGEQSVPLVKEASIYYQGTPQTLDVGIFTPKFVFWSLFFVLLAITFFGFKKDKVHYWIDIILFSVMGLLGIFLLLLWTATDHRAAANNLNLLWAIPLHFPAALLLIPREKGHYLGNYFMIVSALMVLLLIFWPLIPQGYNAAFFPIVATLGLRAGHLFYRLKKAGD
ncbi:DUF4105 domain-containing protein [Fulvivirgaceae bacterium BMA12]|uniref:DUF4105 domain-containing protein n=1 Tax=Agaribacillus aureus TaxID=3051825 RepID=A0ABT8LHG9_9BACT|nr:DUF4105 domain-containing protein [Fulvivirgaceae bacterium BMA12]